MTSVHFHFQLFSCAFGPDGQLCQQVAEHCGRGGELLQANSTCARGISWTVLATNRLTPRIAVSGFFTRGRGAGHHLARDANFSLLHKLLLEGFCFRKSLERGTTPLIFLVCVEERPGALALSVRQLPSAWRARNSIGVEGFLLPHAITLSKRFVRFAADRRV